MHLKIEYFKLITVFKDNLTLRKMSLNPKDKIRKRK